MNMENTLNEQKKNVFLEILNEFVSQDDLRPWMKSPFNAFDKTLATNGHVLIATPKISEYIDYTDSKDGYFNTFSTLVIKHIYPVVHNIEKYYEVTSLKKALAKCPMLEEYDSIIHKCNACNGDGVVDYEFIHNGKTHIIEEDCPICDGVGEIEKKSDKPNGKLHYDERKLIKLNDSTFSVLRIAEIIFVANKLNRGVITLVYNIGNKQPCLFKIDDLEMLVMPTYSDTDEHIIDNVF